MNRLYKHLKKFKYKIERGIKDLLDLGLIKKSLSPFASSMVLVKKKDGMLSMCINYRGLNKKTINNRYPIPIFDELID